jgi:hypothetical protein
LKLEWLLRKNQGQIENTRLTETGEITHAFLKIFTKTGLFPSHPFQKWWNIGIIIS